MCASAKRLNKEPSAPVPWHWSWARTELCCAVFSLHGSKIAQGPWKARTAVQVKNPNHGPEKHPEDIGGSRHAFLSLSLGFFFIILAVSIISLSARDVCLHYPSTHCTFELSISGSFSKFYWDLVSSFWKKKKKGNCNNHFLRCEDETQQCQGNALELR